MPWKPKRAAGFNPRGAGNEMNDPCAHKVANSKSKTSGGDAERHIQSEHVIARCDNAVH